MTIGSYDVVVLAGGQCKRMYPLTSGTIKALLPVANRPMLSYCLKNLADAGVRSAIVVGSRRCHGLRGHAQPVPLVLGRRREGQGVPDLSPVGCERRRWRRCAPPWRAALTPAPLPIPPPPQVAMGEAAAASIHAYLAAAQQQAPSTSSAPQSAGSGSLAAPPSSSSSPLGPPHPAASLHCDVVTVSEDLGTADALRAVAGRLKSESVVVYSADLLSDVPVQVGGWVRAVCGCRSVGARRSGNKQPAPPPACRRWWPPIKCEARWPPCWWASARRRPPPTLNPARHPRWVLPPPPPPAGRPPTCAAAPPPGPLDCPAPTHRVSDWTVRLHRLTGLADWTC